LEYSSLIDDDLTGEALGSVTILTFRWGSSGILPIRSASCDTTSIEHRGRTEHPSI